MLANGGVNQNYSRPILVVLFKWSPLAIKCKDDLLVLVFRLPEPRLSNRRGFLANQSIGRLRFALREDLVHFFAHYAAA